MTRRFDKSTQLNEKGSDPGVSTRALAIARMIDRICRSPGRYQINLTIPSHRRTHWTIEFQRTEIVRKVDLNR